MLALYFTRPRRANLGRRLGLAQLPVLTPRSLRVSFHPTRLTRQLFLPTRLPLPARHNTMARPKRKAAAPIIDRYSSSSSNNNDNDNDDDDTIIVAPPKRRKLGQPALLDGTSDVENDYSTVRRQHPQREIFRVLTPSEWQRIAKGPIAYVDGVGWQKKPLPPSRTAVVSRKAPLKAKASGNIKDYFRKSLVACRPRAPSSPEQHSAPLLESDIGATPKDEGVVVEGSRPCRQAARKSLDAVKLMISSTDFDALEDSDCSEDELASSHRSRKLPPRGRPKDEESEFGVSDGSATDDASRSSSASEEASSEEAEEGEEEEDQSEEEEKGQTSRLPAAKKSTVKTSAEKKTRATGMVNLAGKGTKLELGLPPLSDTREIFEEITKKGLQKGLQNALDSLPGPLRVATMCSGTESPLLALELFQECLGSSAFELDHLFSAEIVPFKQAYIERNFRPPIIFRDICELTNAIHDAEPKATTAYGGKVAVPRDVDLLIAGTSCVDYSMLNKHKKTVDDGGESGDTYTAVLAYCKAFRPSIVLLENVLGAPWDRMLSDYKKIGYVSTGAFLDTKRFHIPQTRQRGYMVCFDQRATSVSLEGAGKKWTELMSYFKRPASSPVSSFLLPGDQRRTQQHIKDDAPTREIDWTRCELRHTDMRQDLRLGNGRPVTHWSENGSVLVPEGGDPTWYYRMPERIWDLLDIAVMRNALPDHGFYDPWYKTKIWNVSQNVDRQIDQAAFGIIGCITPTMIPFLTDSGRALVPEELLKLQGLPLDKISFTTEQPREIQDLAGNAMSTTVIGPAILSALIAGHRAISRSQADDRRSATPTKSSLGFVTAPTERVAAAALQDTVDLALLLRRAEQAARRCVCETAGKISSRPIQKCTGCGHTACYDCAGNPTHVYKHDPQLSRDRSTPSDFEDFLRSTLPLVLNFTSSSWQDLALSKELEAIVKAIGPQFSLQSIRRTHCWTVTYAGSGARLELSLATDRANWRLFADIPKHLPSNSALRAQLVQPIAVGSARNSLFPDRWQARNPESMRYPIQIRESGDRVASWWARLGLLDYASHTVPAFLDITVDAPLAMLSGRYEYLPHCGKASDSLFKRTDPAQPPMFLFLDPTGTGEPEADCFVFSDNIERLEYDEVRSVFASIAAPWRPWARPGKLATKPQLAVSGTWHEHACYLAASEPLIEIDRLKAVGTVVGAAACTQTVQLLSAFLKGKEIQNTNAPVLVDHKWALEAMGRAFPTSEWRPLAAQAASLRCERCAPSRPELRWALQDNNEIKAYEDMPSAAAYEQAIKARPQAVVLVATQVSDGLKVDLGVNIATLAHRARARLPSAASDVEYVWRILHKTDRTPYVFKKFKLVSNENDDADLHSTDTGLSVELFHAQRQSLAWMIEQEKGARFTLEESEEETVAASGWMASGWMAEVRARATVNVRGGICADHPGFGKTITSLALIGSALKSTSAGDEDIIRDLQTRQPAGLKATTATLIVCPPSLVQQWVDEIKNKMGLQNGVYRIATPKHLSMYTIADFAKAKIIVVSRTVFASPEYTNRLASFAAVPGPAALKGRAFMQWRDYAVQQIPEHLAILEGEGKGSLITHVKATYRANLKNEEFKAMVPSRRHRGQGYIANKNKNQKLTSAQQTMQAAPDTLDTATIDQPLFEMFYFNRLIVDEFHDYDPTDYAATVALTADKRWGLSGTPAIEDFFQVAQMAKLLGVTLPIGSMDAAVIKASSRKALTKDLSPFELFDTMSRHLPSHAKYASIHALHQRFLGTFARQNVGDFSEMKYEDYLVPVHLDVEHRLLYTELSQHLNTTQMRIKATGKSKTTDRNRRLNEAVSSSSTAEEALSKAAAFVDQTSRGVLLDDLIDSCNSHIANLRASLADMASHVTAKEKARFDEWSACMLNEGVDEVASIFASARKASKTTRGGSKNDTGSSVHKLNSLCSRLLMERRSLRYLTTARQLQDDSQNKRKVNRCTNPACATPVPTNYALSAVCGHLICETCYQHNKKAATTLCPAAGCSSAVQAHHLLWTTKMGDLNRTKPSPYGAKLEKTMQLLQMVQSKGEQAILFVQFAQQLQQAALALEHYQISGIVVENAAQAGSQLEAFRASSDTVIVLNAADETAAGSNLQNANHVIFLSPLLQQTQYKYDSTMAQAVGRVRRFGQSRPIYVYRIVALDTIDVDVLEHRERRSDALVEQHAPKISTKHAKAGPERTQLVREDGQFSLRPQSWLVGCDADLDADEMEKVKGKGRVMGWEDFSSLVKFSSKYTENDD